MSFISRISNVRFVVPSAGPWLLVLATLALCSISIFEFPLNHDASWILDMARQVRGGARLYVDIIELNPPLIVWLNIPISALADVFDIPVGDLFRMVVLVLAGGSLAFSVAILRGKLDKNAEWSLLLSACYAVIGAAGYDFGQREHLAVILCFPYISTAILRISEKATRRNWRLAAAVLAAVGFALKPYFLLVPMFVEGLLIIRTRRQIDGSAYVIAGVLAIYAAALFLFSPEYIPLAEMVSRVYFGGYLGERLINVLFVPNFQIAVFLSCFAWIIRPSPRGAFDVVSATALAFACAAIIQNKAWSYHWYPATAFSWLLFGMAANSLITRLGGMRSLLAPCLIGGAAVMLSAAALLSAPKKGAVENPIPAWFGPIIKKSGGGPVMVFSNALRVSYPLVTQPGIGSSSRQPSLALLSASINSNDVEFEDYLRSMIVEDMRRNPPRFLIVDTKPYGMPRSFDFIHYLSRDPIFAQELKSFKPTGKIGNFQFFKRVEAGPAGNNLDR
jgi:hypothetical protein